MTEHFDQVEQWLAHPAQWIRLGTETIGIACITAGVVVAFVQLVVAQSRMDKSKFNPIRLTFGRYLSLALEFQLAADILSTAIAPSWAQLSKLAITAVIRTGLNFFLSLEIKDETAERKHKSEGNAPPSTDARPMIGPAQHNGET